MSCPLRLPAALAHLPDLAQAHQFAARNTAIVELALHHGIGATRMVHLDCLQIDPARWRWRPAPTAPWQRLRTRHPDVWRQLVEGQSPDTPLLRSKSGVRMTRVDVWRVLRRVGLEAQLAEPLHSRRARRWLGYTLARRHALGAAELTDALGVRDPRAIARFLAPPADPAIGPPDPAAR